MKASNKQMKNLARHTHYKQESFIDRNNAILQFIKQIRNHSTKLSSFHELFG